MSNERLWFSKYFRALTLGMVFFPLMFPVFSRVVFDLAPNSALKILLSPLYYLTSALWLMTGLGIRRLKQWSWYALFSAQIATFYFNCLLLVEDSVSNRKLVAFSVSLAVQFFVYWMCRRQMIVPYLFPKIRWWEFGIASMNHIRVTIWSRPAVDHLGQVLDIASSGCFIKTPSDFQKFEPVMIEGEYSGKKFKLEGDVIWAAKSSVTHPKGIGVRFRDLDKEDKKILKIVCSQFAKENENAITVLDA